MAVFVVIGARTGVGLEYIRQLGKEPSNIVGLYSHIECDISLETSLSKLPAQNVSSLGQEFKIDVLNNAAILYSRQKISLNLTAETLTSHFTTNAVGPAKVLQILLPHLAPGAIVANISSGIGSLTMLSDGRLVAETTPYSISKTVLNMLPVHQVKQLNGKAKVVCVDPRHVKTEMGGPNAVLEIADSAKWVFSLLESLTLENSGKFLLYNGAQLP